MNLGRPLITLIDDLWCIDVNLGDGRIVPCAFTPEQAKEIARRINEYYENVSQAGVHHASNALGGPEAL